MYSSMAIHSFINEGNGPERQTMTLGDSASPSTSSVVPVLPDEEQLGTIFDKPKKNNRLANGSPKRVSQDVLAQNTEDQASSAASTSASSSSSSSSDQGLKRPEGDESDKDDFFVAAPKESSSNSSSSASRTEDSDTTTSRNSQVTSTRHRITNHFTRGSRLQSYGTAGLVGAGVGAGIGAGVAFGAGATLPSFLPMLSAAWQTVAVAAIAAMLLSFVAVAAARHYAAKN